MSILARRFRIGAAALACAVAVGAVMTTPALAGKDKDKKAAVGEPAPHFMLKDTKGKTHVLSDALAQEKIVVLEWFNPTCPYVVKHHQTMTTMRDLANKHKDRVVWFAVNSAFPKHPTYALSDKSLEIEEKWELPYPVLVDATGEVGRMYGAKTTPHMYIINSDGVLAYAGGIDDHRKPKAPKDGEKVQNLFEIALDQVLAGKTVTMSESKPYGCSVKYGR